MKITIKSRTLFFLIAVVGLSFFCPDTEAQPSKDLKKKPRTIVTTDGEVDDLDSFIRMLLYTNEFNVEGLIYSSSQWHWKGDGKGTLYTSETRPNGAKTNFRWIGETWMQEMIDKYAEGYENLLKNDNNYPTPQYLKSIIKVGNIDFEGEMEKVTDGSEWIKQILLDDKEGPVYVQLWGGTNTLARALKSIQEEYEHTQQWKEIYKKVSDKTFIYAVLDQDITYKRYVAPNWHDIRVIYNSDQFWSFAYPWQKFVPQSLKPYMEGPWFEKNILRDHGNLMATYFTVGDGREFVGDPDYPLWNIVEGQKNGMKQYDFVSEGDSPSYFYLIDLGLRNLESPAYGGLGGRFVQSVTNPKRWEDRRDVTDFNPETGKEESSYPQIRWIEVLQNDFAARADWCVNDYANANHYPEVKLNHAENIEATAGESVTLSGIATDPDGNKLNYKWWQYKEAGTYTKMISSTDEKADKVKITIPSDAQSGQTIHFILEVKDNGTPVLTKFKRVIITVK